MKAIGEDQAVNKNTDIIADQSYSERQLFEKAYERILTEFQIILNLSLEDTQKKLDKALKRNLAPQPQSNTTSTKQTASELPVEETTADNEVALEE